MPTPPAPEAAEVATGGPEESPPRPRLPPPASLRRVALPRRRPRPGPVAAGVRTGLYFGPGVGCGRDDEGLNNGPVTGGTWGLQAADRSGIGTTSLKAVGTISNKKTTDSMTTTTLFDPKTGRTQTHHGEERVPPPPSRRRSGVLRTQDPDDTRSGRHSTLFSVLHR